MTAQVSPEERATSGGCGSWHNLENFAGSSVYTRVVAWRMLPINAQHASHVGVTGVTCRRDNPAPLAT